MRTHLLPVPFAVVILACAGGGSGPLDAAHDPGTADVADGADAIDPGAPDPGSDAAAPDAADPGPIDPGVTDPGVTDPGVTDPGPDAGCPPDCQKLCPFGFRTGPDGCNVCECRACATAQDCAATMTCDHPQCTDRGDCTCDCAASEGIRAYACPGGDDEVLWCACSVLGVQCIDRPETYCPSLCRPGQSVPWTCTDGTPVPWCDCEPPDCVPECREVGTAAEGWYDSCTDALVRTLPCAGCTLACKAVGSKSEGWVESCTGTFLGWAQCAPERVCIPDPAKACTAGACSDGIRTTYACPDGSEVPFCACQDGAWNCVAEPWTACASPCVREGGGFTEPAAGCCPGLSAIPVATWDGDTCGFVNCPCNVCTFCGDGLCRAPENRCNCPGDCFDQVLPVALGQNCSSHFDCAEPGIQVCLAPEPLDPVGICTRTCNPGNADPCGAPGFVCQPVPIHQPAGFCMKGCTFDGDCVPPATCRVSELTPGGPAGCYVWGT